MPSNGHKSLLAVVIVILVLSVCFFVVSAVFSTPTLHIPQGQPLYGSQPEFAQSFETASNLAVARVGAVGIVIFVLGYIAWLYKPSPR
jgi:cytochrome bd-type quinol oxidase subunit 2